MADKSKDTGTGGIDIDGEVYTMDVGVSDANGGSQGDWSPGDISVDNTVKDISKPTRETFAKYLSRSTLGQVGSSPHPNKFPVGTGNNTPVQNVNLTTTTGLPVRPGPQPNASKFNNSFDTSIGSPAPLPIKKGLAPGSDPDGNTLLPTAATPAPSGGKYVKPAQSLNEPINTYLTTKVLNQNLYDAATPTTPVVPSDGSLNSSPQNVRDIRHIPAASSVATDGGTSESILGPANILGLNVLTQAEAAALAGSVTAAAPTANTYKVDSGAPTLVKLNDVDGSPIKPAPSPNADKFNATFDNAIGTPIVSGIKKGKATGGPNDKDGNTLLPTATNNAGALVDPIKKYTDASIVPNLNDYNSTKAVVGDGGNITPNDIDTRNIRFIPETESVATVGGKSNIILSPTAASSLTLPEAAAQAGVYTGGTYVPGNVSNKYPIDVPDPDITKTIVKIYDASGNPISATDAQQNPKNSEYYTEDNPLQTSYTDAFIQAKGSTNNPLLIKRGKSSAPGVDGNDLLKNIAPLDPNGKPVLAPGPTNYTKTTLDVNLRSPLDDNPPYVPLNIENPPQQLPLHYTNNIEVDGGKSSTVLSPDPAHTLTFLESKNIASETTSNNKYSVDSSPSETVNSITDGNNTPSVTNQQNNPINSDYYTKGKNLQTSYSDNSTNLDLKRGKVASTAVDGNDILPTAADTAPAGGPHVKPSGPLKDPVKKYTLGVFSKNLYKPDSNVDLADVDPKSFSGNVVLHQPVDESDRGTFDNIRSDPDKKAITRNDLLQKAEETLSGNGSPAVANAYKPEESYSRRDSLGSIVDENGFPISPSAAQNNETDKGLYAPGVVKTLKTYSELAADLNAGIRRGKSRKPTTTPDGNTLLKDSAKPARDDSNQPAFTELVDSPVKSYVSAVLRQNRFSPESNARFAPDEYLDPTRKLSSPDLALFDDIGGTQPGNPRGTFEGNATFAPKSARKLGSSEVDPGARSYTYSRLSRIGTILQLRASGEIVALADTEKPGIDPRDPLVQLAALAPGLGAVGGGVPVPGERLNIESIIEDLATDEGLDYERYKGVTTTFNTTYEGVINNVFDKFSGFTALGMIASVTVLVAVIVTVFTGLGFLFGTSGKVSGGRHPRRSGGTEGPHASGAFYGQGIGTASPDDIINAFIPVGGDSSFILRFFGIMPTSSDLGTATRLGALSFFGVDEDYNPLTTFQSPGYFVVMAKAIVRSAAIIAIAFKDLIELFASANFTSGFEQILEIIGILKTSRFFASINIFAQIGDASNGALSTPDGDYLPIDVTKEGFDAGIKKSTIDSMSDDDPRATHVKSRLGNGLGPTTKLAWSTRRSPALFAVSAPARALGLATLTALDSGRLLLDDPLAKIRVELINASDPVPRISTEIREAYEASLDSEYVPFYFHDLRTNEILSFHAFLGSLSDDYTANYETTEGYGRVDAIKAYKNTQRKIGLSFTIAALDEQDFDHMWMKINKLTTLVYPQFTQGKKIAVSTGNSFIKPFTQVIGASPMIRLRVGNLIASNYSKFNLARIFGADLPSTTLEGKNLQEDELTNFIDFFSPIETGQTFYPMNKTYKPREEVKTGPEEFSPSQWQNMTLLQVVTPPEDQTDPEATAIVKFIRYNIKEDGGPEPASLNSYKIYAGWLAAGLVLDVLNQPYTFEVKASDLLTSPTAKTQKAFASSSPSIQEYGTKVSQFMDVDKNAIARSFRSAGGQGLAGFIESLSYDWFNATTWDTSDGRKAPKMCKVTISFAPVHDITPGLDSLGYNRAPVYPVGVNKRNFSV